MFFLDLIPIFSYLFLGGKCRYCKNKIRIRYFLLEILSGVCFTLYAISLNINWYNIDIQKIVYLIVGLLYFAVLFIIAGIDKENKMIQKSVLGFGLVIEMIYMIYVCTYIQPNNVYGYVIYLFVMFVIMMIDIHSVKRKLESNYTIQVLSLLLFMRIFSTDVVVLLTAILTVVFSLAVILIKKIKKNKRKNMNISKEEKLPIGFYMCIVNIICIIINNFHLI